MALRTGVLRSPISLLTSTRAHDNLLEVTLDEASNNLGHLSAPSVRSRVARRLSDFGALESESFAELFAR
jgi:hypothetical protein